MMGAVEQPDAIPFASLARLLAAETRRHGLACPSFCTPPRVPGANRTIRRMHGGGLMVAVRVRERHFDDVLDDMVEGVLVLNGFTDHEARGWRLALRSVVGGEDRAAA
jgi:hypothetical protein